MYKSCELESVFLEIINEGKRNEIFGCIYRHPSMCLDEFNKNFFKDFIEKLSSENKITYLSGDFNIDLLKADRDSLTLTEHLNGNGLKQHIQGPTRSDLTSESLIDHLWTTDSMDITSGIVTGVSDHAGIYAILPEHLDTQKIAPKIGRSYKTYAAAKMQSDFQHNLENSDFEKEIQMENVENASHILTNAIRQACDRNAPEKTFKQRAVSQCAPWFTPELFDLKEQKEEALTADREKNTSETKEKLRALCNKIKSVKRKLKKEHYAMKIEQHQDNSKKLWQLLREATRSQADDANTEPESLDIPTANAFNHFFSTVGRTTLEKLNLSEPSFSPTAEHGFTFQPTTPSEIEELINGIKCNSATGHDRIPPNILKDIKSVLSTPLSKLINISFEKSIFPSEMKHAIVRPIYKNKGSENDPQYYRPISILTSISKIVERAAVNRLVKFLETEHKLFHSQHAYRKHHSTTTSLVEITEYIHQELDNQRIPAVIATDLSKAFDSVSHGLLLRKLQDLGLHKASTAWIASYLTDRTQTTKFSTVESEKEKILAGVPQGSIMGPVLFIRFHNRPYGESQGMQICILCR